MSDIGEYYREMRAMQRERGCKRRGQAHEDWEEAADLAHSLDMKLVGRSLVHYQLTVYLSHEPLIFWLYNLYPGNRRICADRNHKGPFLDVPSWSFVELVKAADQKRSEHERSDGKASRIEHSA